jgi:POT family proton-dependent oligopeptide transporter
MSHPANTGKHPKGLYVLFATEMWERFNFYGMRAILVLFMTKALLFNDVFASNLYGSYIGLIYLTPLIGGYVADRYWGNKRSIFAGGIIMVIGELFLFFCGTFYNSNSSLSTFLFFGGLGLMIAGNGFFKPNISSLVGQLYPAGDTRKDAAYTIFYMGINVGGALGPLACGLVGDTGNPADFKWAFLVGAVAMVLSLLVQKLYHDKYVLDPGGKILGQTPLYGIDEVTGMSSVQSGKAPSRKWLDPVYMIIGLLIFSGIMISAMYLDAHYSYLTYLLAGASLFIAVFILSDKSLNKVDKQRIWVIFIVCFFVIFFWAAYEQTGASLVFFADRQTNLTIGSYTMPPSYFQSFNSIFIILFALPLAWIWVKMGKKQPATPTKMAMGLAGLALGYWWIARGVHDVALTEKVSMIWLTGMYALHTLGELCLSPIGLSLVNKLSPLKFASLLMAVWFLANAAGNKFAGVMSALYPEGGKTTAFLGYKMNNLYEFFMLFVFMAGFAAIVLFLLSKRLQKMMHGIT